ncbi:hypothetical protein B0H15DRAFT_844896 [Mycena belliarum]|uniref:Uncharacterized protein n=1 Tax=Mycena belliarum TaxID=1033014 RepID=A0AAD6XLD3_9AGAR|nr:hypothetical protein B0H15DRAFT_844896 [Mycena belliae]
MLVASLVLELTSPFALKATNVLHCDARLYQFPLNVVNMPQNGSTNLPVCTRESLVYSDIVQDTETMAQYYTTSMDVALQHPQILQFSTWWSCLCSKARLRSRTSCIREDRNHARLFRGLSSSSGSSMSDILRFKFIQNSLAGSTGNEPWGSTCTRCTSYTQRPSSSIHHPTQRARNIHVNEAFAAQHTPALRSVNSSCPPASSTFAFVHPPARCTIRPSPVSRRPLL